MADLWALREMSLQKSRETKANSGDITALKKESENNIIVDTEQWYQDTNSNALPADGNFQQSIDYRPIKEYVDQKDYKKIQGEDNLKFLCFPKDDSILVQNGCYYFKLSYAPNYTLDDKFRLDKLKANTIQADVAKMEGMLAGSAKEFLKEKLWVISDAYNYLLGQKLDPKFQDKELNSISEIGTAIAIGKLAQQFNYYVTDNLNKDFVVNLYDTQELNSAVVFLPLNSMTVKRNSGVNAAENVIGSMIRQQAVGNLRTYETAKGTDKNVDAHANIGQMMTAEGYSNNKYKGFVTAGADYESYALTWKLMPKSEEEMKELIQILIYFQCACISNLNLNDKNNLKWILPPVCELGILAQDFSSETDSGRERFKFEFKDTTKQHNYLNQREAKGTPEVKKVLEKYDVTENNEDNKKIKTYWLRKPVTVYIKNVDVTPIANDGGVLLSPEGYPMGVELKVEFIRTTLTTLDNLWDVEDGNKDKELKRNVNTANPFA
jgi:hypothetical protein